jgi:hypothetical protein
LFRYNPQKKLYFYVSQEGISGFDPSNLIFGFSDPVALNDSGVKFSEYSKNSFIKLVIESPPDISSFQITIKYGSIDQELTLDFSRIKTKLAHTSMLPSVLKGGHQGLKMLILGSQGLSHNIKVFCR